jgi:hypothetical protein
MDAGVEHIGEASDLGYGPARGAGGDLEEGECERLEVEALV